jgi:ribosomal protein S18 acetylase RimI-like enzyme
MERHDGDVVVRLSPPVSDAQLNALFAAAWPGHRDHAFAPLFARSLAYLCAYVGERLAGFVNLAWDGGIHAFILDTTVHPHFQRRGIGTRLVLAAADAARERGIAWLHVDYEPHLEPFYRACGFVPTLAGLMRLDGQPQS